MVLSNNIIKHNIQIIFIIIFSSLISCSDHNINSKSVCPCKIYSEKIDHHLFDSLINVQVYVVNIEQYVNQLKKNQIKEISFNCSKAQIAEYLLKKQIQFDSIIITPSGHGISFHRKDDDSWSNIIID
jgi:LPS O-antigen subunit length determinant protein (WzzB/FepE family)